MPDDPRLQAVTEALELGLEVSDEYATYRVVAESLAPGVSRHV